MTGRGERRAPTARKGEEWGVASRTAHSTANGEDGGSADLRATVRVLAHRALCLPISRCDLSPPLVAVQYCWHSLHCAQHWSVMRSVRSAAQPLLDVRSQRQQQRRRHSGQRATGTSGPSNTVDRSTSGGRAAGSDVLARSPPSAAQPAPTFRISLMRRETRCWWNALLPCSMPQLLIRRSKNLNPRT